MSNVVRASQFVVVDESGRARARLGMIGGRVGLELLALDEDGPSVEVGLDESGTGQLRLRRGEQRAELTVGERSLSFRLSCGSKKSACGMCVDDAGAWLVAEATEDLGVRILCRNDGQGTSVWLSESCEHGDETCVHTRYLRPDPGQDKASQWQKRA
jgi:hypothetical protein